ncbi:Cell division protein [Maritimibacter sp. HL-12]|nr:Cell division protein [Maritimibacter sp. HL-12]
MKLLRHTSALALAVIVSGTAASAYTLQQAAKPAETPPASYRSDVYVDSRGCAYVRANIGSSVNWVPRLSSDRKTVICGLTPSASGSGTASARPPAPPAPPRPSAPASPDQATTTAAASPSAPPEPAASKPAAPSPISRTMNVTCPADGSTARVRIGSRTLAVRCAPGQTTAKSYIIQHGNGERTRLVANPASVAAPEPKTVARVPSTPMPTASSGRVKIGGVAPGTVPAPQGHSFGRGFGVTSGPGVTDPVPTPGQAVRRAPATPAPAATSGGSSAPPESGTERVVIPSGYRQAWDDDRLNPNRGPLSASGDQQMAAKWDVTKVPMQKANPAPARGLVEQPGAGGFSVFTKSPSAVPAAVAEAPEPVATKRYVQVGAFNVAANAERAAARLQALGLPGRVAQTRSGRTVVVAGPYDNAAALRTALAAARSGGFSDAFLRN